MSSESHWFRSLRLVLFSVTAGAMLGGVAGVATVPFAAILGVFVGAAAGLFISPLVAFCLHGKNQAVSMSLVIAVTIVVTLFSLGARLPHRIMLLSVGTMCAMCIVVLLFMSRVSKFPVGCCDSCGYNLTGNETGRCPECGTDFTSLEQRPVDQRWLPLTLATVVVLATSGFIARAMTAQMRPASDVPGLIQQLANNEALIHEVAVRELVRRGKKPLLIALSSPNPAIRRQAVRGLSRLGDPTTVPDLIAVLDDADPWVRNWAARALGELNDPSAICPLLEARMTSTGLALNGIDTALELLEVPEGAIPADYGCKKAEERSTGS